MALASNALTTYAIVKAELGLTDDTQQSYLERQINVISDKIEKYCGRNFKRQEYTEQLYQGNDNLFLLLQNSPIIEVTEIDINGTTMDLTNIQEFDSGNIYLPDGFWKNGIIRGMSYLNEGYINPQIVKYDIKVTYEAGYTLPKDDTVPTPRDLPYDLEEACVMEVVNKYNSKGTAQKLQSWSLDKASKTYAGYEKTFDSKTGFLNSTVSLLDANYKRIDIL